jgi:uncharacterized protein
VSLTSRYTFAVPCENGVLLYNANSGAVLRLAGADAVLLADMVGGSPRLISHEDLPGTLTRDLRAAGMLLPPGTDELAMVRARYRRARRDTPMTLTVTTTMDCNLGCYYCYEERSNARLQIADVTTLTALTESRLVARGRRSLHVDWYGGEPLLNIEFLEAASRALQELSARLGVAYSASVISNGTAWPDDVGVFVRTHKLSQVQISFDGLQKNHDRRRRYRRGRAPSSGASSFNCAVALVDRLLDHVRVDVRINIDRGNQGDVPAFLAMMRERGWFARRYPAVVQPARLSAYSARSAFMRRTELTAAEFDAVRTYVRTCALAETDFDVTVEESEVPDGFPFPRTSVCAALARDSAVVGADGTLYRCGLQVGESHRGVGTMETALPNGGRASAAEPVRRSLPVLTSSGDPAAEASWWDAFDPTELPTCARCSFLPICWAGCPKKHLEGDVHAIAEQGAYWRGNLARLVAEGVGVNVLGHLEYMPRHQFRDGPE